MTRKNPEDHRLHDMIKPKDVIKFLRLYNLIHKKLGTVPKTNEFIGISKTIKTKMNQEFLTVKSARLILAAYKRMPRL